MARAPANSDAFNAIAEPQRRQILVLLKEGECPVNDVAQALCIAAPRASKHLRVLREVGLVRVRAEGRQRLYGLDARGLRPVHEWLGGFEQFWSGSFDRLNAYVRELHGEASRAHCDRRARRPGIATSASPVAPTPSNRYLNAGLVDEFHVAVAPVLLGAGLRLFDRIEQGRLTVVRAESLHSPRVTHLRYAVKRK